MAEQTTFEEVLAQAYSLTLFQKIHLMEKLAEWLQLGLRQYSQQEWYAFIDQTAGSLADAPVERPPQGEYPIREPIE